MHHSDDPSRQALAVSCYLDESATDGSTPTAVVGGLLLNASFYKNLDLEWGSMLTEFDLLPALHMKDFGLHGRFANIGADRLRAIFVRATSLIADHRIYTLSATLNHRDYQEAFSGLTRQHHSAYEMCFIMAALGNGKMAVRNNYNDPIAFVVDSGNPYAEHVRLAHREMEKLYKETGFPSNIGTLTFSGDESISALQAADIVCWGARRRAVALKFPAGMESIEYLFNETVHATIPVEKAALQELERHWSARLG